MLKRWRGERWFHAHETARFDALNGLPLASFKRRAWAFLLDLAIVVAIKGLFGGGPIGHLKHLAEEHGELMVRILDEGKEIIESVLYFGIALKLGKGQTPGKRLMKIKVVSLTEDSMGWWQSIERALGYAASLLEGGFGFAQFYLNRNRMCVHDRIAETIVVDLQRPRTHGPLHPHVVKESLPAETAATV